MSPVPLAFDPERAVDERVCPDCRRSYLNIKGFILKDNDAHAIFFAALHSHDAPEAWIDVILGTFGDDDPSDHVTFGCRVGAIDGQLEPAATLVPAAKPYGNAPIWGVKLDREAALLHPRLPEFWEVVDFVLTKDDDVHSHIYG